MKRILEVKRTRDGLLLKIDAEGEFEDVLSQLQQQLKENAEFYRAHRFVGTRGRSLTYAEKAQIDNLLFQEVGSHADSLEVREDSPKKLSAEDEESIRSQVYREYQRLLDDEITPKLQRLEQELRVAKEKNEEYEKSLESRPTNANGSNVRIHQGTLRSGSRIDHDGHVIVIGDINAGAEVVATGNIICTGKALGLVHAGSGGAEDSFVLAFHLAPIQIRISKYVSGPPSGKKYKPNNYPEMAKLVDGFVRIVGV